MPLPARLGAVERATRQGEETTMRSALSSSSMASRPSSTLLNVRQPRRMHAPGSSGTIRLQPCHRSQAIPATLPSLYALFDSVARDGGLAKFGKSNLRCFCSSSPSSLPRRRRVLPRRRDLRALGLPLRPGPARGPGRSRLRGRRRRRRGQAAGRGGPPENYGGRPRPRLVRTLAAVPAVCFGRDHAREDEAERYRGWDGFDLAAGCGGARWRGAVSGVRSFFISLFSGLEGVEENNSLTSSSFAFSFRNPIARNGKKKRRSRLAGRVVEGNVFSSRALARILPAFLFRGAPWHAAKTPAESAPAAAAALAAAAGAPAAAAALLPPPPAGAPAGTRQLVAAASAFGNCVSLPLVVLGALLPTVGVGGGGSPYETAAAYVSLYALGWSPMLWTLGGMI